MTASDIAIILLAIMIGVFYLKKVRNYDLYEKETFSKLILTAILGGITSVGISLFIYDFVPMQNPDFFDAVFKVGIIEELSKLISLVIVVRYIKKDFDEIVDGIIYITAISLGFAIIENVFYSFNSTYPFQLLALRSFTSVIGHICFSSTMGVAFFIHKRIHKNYIGLILTVAIAAFAHGLYDGVLFHEELNIIFILVYILIIILYFAFLRFTLSYSRYKPSFELSSFESIEYNKQFACLSCSSKNIFSENKVWKIKVIVCNNCQCNHIHKNIIKKVFRYYRPGINWRSGRKQIKNIKNEAVIFNNTFLYGQRSEISDWLKNENINDLRRNLNRPVLGFILKIIGFRYINNKLKQNSTTKQSL